MKRPTSLPASLRRIATHPPISRTLCTVTATASYRSGQTSPIPRHRSHLHRQPRTHSFPHHHRSKSSLSNSNPTQLPLSGLRILDLSRVLAGPFCTQLLADYGADVIKIEQPGQGDETRVWRAEGETTQMWKDGMTDSEWEGNSKGAAGGEVEDLRGKYKLMSLYFASVNRNKRSVTVDLKSDEGQALIRRLITEWPSSHPTNPAGADVLVHNFLPGKIEKMGLGYDTVSKWNSRLIYASVSGYGSTGPMRTRAGYDAIALAESGLLHITGETRSGAEPVKPGVAIADLCTGLYVHGAILAALQERQRTGRGDRVEGSLLESSMALMINVGLGAVNLDLEGEKRRRGKKLGMGHASLVPYGGYETKDGRWFFVAANNNRQWRGFCDKLAAGDLAGDERFQSNDGRVEAREELNARLSEKFKRKTLAEWKGVFEGSGLPYGAVNDVVEALEMEQSVDRGMIREIEGLNASRSGTLKVLGSAVKFGNYPRQVQEASRKDGQVGIGDVRIKPPLLGEHTDDVLRDVLGLEEDEMQALRDKGVV